MAKKFPKTLRGIRGALQRDVFMKSKAVRKAIDRNPMVLQVTKLDEAYAEKFNEFAKEINAAAAEHGANSAKRIRLGGKDDDPQSGAVFTIKTAKRMVDTMAAADSAATGENLGFANFRQQNYFFKKLFPEMTEGYELGHKNISVLRANMALALDTFPQDDPRRKMLLALYSIVQELDAVEEKGINLIDLIEKTKKAASRKRNFTVDWNKDISTVDGLDYRIELEYEEIGLNQEKGLMAAKIGEIFKSLVEGEAEKVETFLAGISYENLRGSPDLIDDILDLAADTIDPKKKSKRRKSSSRDRGSLIGRGSKPRNRASLTEIRQPKRTRANTSQRKDLSPLALAALINNKLPDIVAKNMVPPRLQLRTGRLAQSARVIDVQATRQGFPSIGFTYEKDPYAVFESTSGTRFSDRERDPRNLIDASIREIAATLVTGRLFTRRI